MSKARRRMLEDDAGSAPAEFVLVGGLLTLMTLAVLQFALAVYVRNVVHDAAVEGAFHAALADTTDAEGADRAREMVARAIGAGHITDVQVVEEGALGHASVAVTIRSTLPLVGFLGAPSALEVTGRAPVESLG